MYTQNYKKSGTKLYFCGGFKHNLQRHFQHKLVLGQKKLPSCNDENSLKAVLIKTLFLFTVRKKSPKKVSSAPDKMMTNCLRDSRLFQRRLDVIRDWQHYLSVLSTYYCLTDRLHYMQIYILPLKKHSTGNQISIDNFISHERAAKNKSLFWN